MPFQKRGRYYYHGGKRYTARQVRAYYATRGFKRKTRRRRKT